ncbi:MAG TPA: hypothetical protein PK878_15900, partial [bacterium]|nr:hypothetical protein [bacterium]
MIRNHLAPMDAKRRYGIRLTPQVRAPGLLVSKKEMARPCREANSRAILLAVCNPRTPEQSTHTVPPLPPPV